MDVTDESCLENIDFEVRFNLKLRKKILKIGLARLVHQEGSIWPWLVTRAQQEKPVTRASSSFARVTNQAKLNPTRRTRRVGFLY